MLQVPSFQSFRWGALGCRHPAGAVEEKDTFGSEVTVSNAVACVCRMLQAKTGNISLEEKTTAKEISTTSSHKGVPNLEDRGAHYPFT